MHDKQISSRMQNTALEQNLFIYALVLFLYVLIELVFGDIRCKLILKLVA